MSDAAACALQMGDWSRAIELLDHGRAILLARSLEARTDLSDLRRHMPDVATRFERVRRELDAPVRGPNELPHTPGPLSDRRYDLAREWDALLAWIRAQPGFEGFLLRPSAAELCSQAANGAIVQVNVSRHRSDAVILTPGWINVVPLGDLTPGALSDRTALFLSALEETAGPDMARQWNAERQVCSTLDWLWTAIAEPVLEALGHRTTPPPGTPWPRLWWSPTGMLNFLPLHAARREGVAGASVTDRVVSSYTATVHTLRHVRARRSPAQERSALIVAEGGANLPAVHPEAAAVRRLFPQAIALSGPGATRERVLAMLPAASWVHFACHAWSEVTDPSHSHLLVHDRELSVLDISRLDIPDAELAFLSACGTARGGTVLADEAIHIASAFQIAGYWHVIGTLWTVADDIAARIADETYRELASTGAERTAHALHSAVHRLRDTYPDTPSLWAAHIHAGP